MTLPRALVLIAVFGLSACGGGEKDFALTDFRNTRDGPDEFAVLPGKPLQAPADYAALPTPTPGGANLTDQYPLADGVAALGGNPAALNATGVPQGDAGLVSHATRYGVSPGIRMTLAEEDEKFRRFKWAINRYKIDKRELYNDVYRREWLNAYAELERLRRLGIITPSAPPN